MRLAYALLCVGLGSTGAWAQSVISAHSGVVHYIEGDVAIDGSSLHPKFGEFPDLKNGQVLTTEEGRAEILLTPGVFLRLGENSSVRMVSNALADTHLQLVSGTALLEAGELLPHNAITIDCAGVQIALPKKGLYGIDASAARLRVYDGQAQATLGEQQVVARKSHEIALDSETLADTKFDAKETDPFYRWNARRSEYISDANITSARIESNSNTYVGGGAHTGAWNWNPYFGMFTFMPATGVYASPFGSTFYSPGMMSAYFLPEGAYGYGYGYGGPTVYGGTPMATGSVASRPGSFGGGSRASAVGGGGFAGASGAGGGGFAGASHAGGGGGHPGGGGVHR